MIGLTVSVWPQFGPKVIKVYTLTFALLRFCIWYATLVLKYATFMFCASFVACHTILWGSTAVLEHNVSDFAMYYLGEPCLTAV